MRDSDDTQKDESLRIIVNYDIQSSFGFFEIKGGYLHDLMVYNHYSNIRTQQYLGTVFHIKIISETGSFDLAPNGIIF